MKTLNHILPLVEKPSRYIGGEINSKRKSDGEVRLRMALAFPDTYEIGMSHFGIQILYYMLNARTDIAAERVFAPGVDMARHLTASDMRLFSLETRRPLTSFDIIGFSLLYELNYTNILMMLDLAGIPFYAQDRNETFPFVIAGGPCTVNPEPTASFFDAMVIGDGESVIIEMAENWMQWKYEGGRDKTELLKAWAGIRGVYVPAFFSPFWDAAGRQKLASLLPGYERVQRAAVADLDVQPFPEAPVVPFGRPVHDRFRLEIARGCTRGCRFCQAGFIYRPVRERSLSGLAGLAEKGLCQTGYEEMSLLSLSTGDYSCLLDLLKELMNRHGSRRFAISIPSFRAGTLSSEMMEIIRSVRKTGFTIAPEAGTEHLRSVINKNLTEAEIAATMKSAFDLGWQLIKLYFMIGLPTETARDAEEIAYLVHRLRRNRPRRGRGGNINVSVATFIPKSHVPFQWSAQLDTETAKDRIETVRSRLSVKGVDFKWQKPELSFLEGVFARGDRRLAKVLEAAWKRGCRFDGWSDSFDGKAWSAAFSDVGVDPEFFLESVPFEAPLPWDHIDTGVGRDFLRNEYERALSGDPTPDCRNGECQGCGVCDFKTLEPEIAGNKEENADECLSELLYPDLGMEDSKPPPARARRIKITYTKLGPGRYFGHLELANIFIRALLRAGIGLVYSSGYHPKPRIAFTDALPVGIESMCEHIFLTVSDESGPMEIKDAVNLQLPEGLECTFCVQVPDKAGPGSRQQVTYRIVLEDGTLFDEDACQRFLQAESFDATVRSGRGVEKRIDLKSFVVRLCRVNPNTLSISLAEQTGPVIRPGQAVSHIFQLPGDALLRARILKIKEEPADTDQSEIQRGFYG
ncbi:MAG: TIGR03960 family B12-binding radical SAM protein [Desulfobacteraceae bacterium]|nr:TIGR03960 family B12-binding radical SAM protein [Desulfobacteraceae bacterium]